MSVPLHNPPAGVLAAPPPEPQLPIYFTPFIGREQKQANLLQLLANASCRLVTLLGPGGVGKTRLAVEVASRAAISPTVLYSCRWHL